MSNENVLYRVEDGVAWLTLNRPQRLNAMTNALMQGICDVLAQVDKDQTVRVVVITGAGHAFCAGADLQQVANPDPSRRCKADRFGFHQEVLPEDSHR